MMATLSQRLYAAWLLQNGSSGVRSRPARSTRRIDQVRPKVATPASAANAPGVMTKLDEGKSDDRNSRA